MGIPALEDGLFVNLLIFNYLCSFPRVFLVISVVFEIVFGGSTNPGRYLIS